MFSNERRVDDDTRSSALRRKKLENRHFRVSRIRRRIAKCGLVLGIERERERFVLLSNEEKGIADIVAKTNSIHRSN